MRIHTLPNQTRRAGCKGHRPKYRNNEHQPNTQRKTQCTTAHITTNHSEANPKDTERTGKESRLRPNPMAKPTKRRKTETRTVPKETKRRSDRTRNTRRRSSKKEERSETSTPIPTEANPGHQERESRDGPDPSPQDLNWPKAVQRVVQSRRGPQVKVNHRPASLESQMFMMCSGRELRGAVGLESCFQNTRNVELSLQVGDLVWGGLLFRPDMDSAGTLYILFSFTHSSHRGLGIQLFLLEYARRYYSPLRLVRQASNSPTANRVPGNERLGFQATQTAAALVNSPEGRDAQCVHGDCLAMERPGSLPWRDTD